ncbi:MAG TPA: ribosomal-protein-alanine N-acetyltransferase [bacterium]|nr:ribosomal-protein-alanine N-acetyltransferase [bacterium]
MTEDDIDAVWSIEQSSFPFPWSRESFQRELDQSHTIALVAVDQGGVAGFIIAWMIIDEMHIGNIAVHPRMRRKKIASGLLSQLISGHPDIVWFGLEVRKSNTPAIALYQKYGFTVKGVRKQYYEKEREDAIIMVLDRQKIRKGEYGLV